MSVFRGQQNQLFFLCPDKKFFSRYQEMGHDFIDGGKKEDSYIVLDNPTKWPDYSHIDSYHEPMVKGKAKK